MFLAQPGLVNLLKEGNKYFSGLEESTYRNIDACKKLYDLTKTSFGPNCMKKLIVTQIEKLYLTSDTATMIQQLDIQHPAVKLLGFASKMQEQEFGDGTNYVIMIAGQLLVEAELLLKQGLHVVDIIKGFEMALEKCLELFDNMVVPMKIDLRNKVDLKKGILTTITPKSLGYEDMIADLITEATCSVIPTNIKDFNVDNVRVVKLLGGGLNNESYVVNGMVVTRNVSGNVHSKDDCKVMVLGSGLEISSTETKSTVLLKDAQELLKFSKDEEELIEEYIKNIASVGVGAIIVGGIISDVALSFCDKYNILLLKCTSKFELKRLCETLKATSMLRLAVPKPDDLGYASSIKVQEISSNNVTVIKSKDSNISTIVLRGATNNMLDELERTIDDGIHCVRNIISDSRFVPGAGACEIEFSQELQKYGLTVSGLEQYGVLKFAEALECIPKCLASTIGVNGNEVVSQLKAIHKADNKYYGVDLSEITTNNIKDVINCDKPIIDHLETKKNALKLAVDASITVLRIDQIIMAKPAGGPKLPQKQGNWDED